MTVSKEVQAAVDEIRNDRDLIKSMKAADKVRDQQLADMQAKLDAASDHMSDEDRQALVDAVSDARDTNDALTQAVTANTNPTATDGNAQAPASQAVPPQGSDGHPTEPPTSGDVLSANGPANHPAGGSAVPMMPNSAFDPNGGNSMPPSTDGQPNQPSAIETSGGFVIAGGGSTSRAPGSMPDSPSSSLVVPLDPDAKGPASNADLVKSGLGDSSQNALLGNDGQPIADGPGVVRGPPDSNAMEAAQEQADKLEAERQARADNPLNLAPAGTPQAGSPEADKAAQVAREEEQRKAVAAEQARNDAEQGKPAPSTPGPDPVSAPTTPPPPSPAP